MYSATLALLKNENQIRCKSETTLEEVGSNIGYGHCIYYWKMVDLPRSRC